MQGPGAEGELCTRPGPSFINQLSAVLRLAGTQPTMQSSRGARLSLKLVLGKLLRQSDPWTVGGDKIEEIVPDLAAPLDLPNGLMFSTQLGYGPAM